MSEISKKFREWYEAKPDLYQPIVLEAADEIDRLERALAAREKELGEAVKRERERCVIAFVQGAKWWQFTANGATAFPSEVDTMTRQAQELQSAGVLGLHDDERIARIQQEAGEGER